MQHLASLSINEHIAVYSRYGICAEDNLNKLCKVLFRLRLDSLLSDFILYFCIPVCFSFVLLLLCAYSINNNHVVLCCQCYMLQ